MKQYKYKINGNLYNVTVNDPEENIVNVEVNGTPYKVELDKPVKPAVAPKPVTRPAAAPKTDSGDPPSNLFIAFFQHSVQIYDPLLRCWTLCCKLAFHSQLSPRACPPE